MALIVLCLLGCMTLPEQASAYLTAEQAAAKEGYIQFIKTAPEYAPGGVPTTPTTSCGTVCLDYGNAAAERDLLRQTANNVRWRVGLMRAAGVVGAGATAFWVGWKIGTELRHGFEAHYEPNPAWYVQTFATEEDFNDWVTVNEVVGAPALPGFWISSPQYSWACPGSTLVGSPGACASGDPPVEATPNPPLTGNGLLEMQFIDGLGSRSWLRSSWTGGAVAGPYVPGSTSPAGLVPTEPGIDWENWPTTEPGVAPPEEEIIEQTEEEVSEDEEKIYEVGFPIGWPDWDFGQEEEPDPGDDPTPEVGLPWPFPANEPKPDSPGSETPSDEGGVDGSPGDGTGSESCAKWLKPKLNFKPLDVTITNIFPFALPIYLYGVVTMFDDAGEAPSWSIPIHGNPLTVDLSAFDGFMNTFRAVVGLLFFVSTGIMVARWAFGNPGDD